MARKRPLHSILVSAFYMWKNKLPYHDQNLRDGANGSRKQQDRTQLHSGYVAEGKLG